MKESSIERVNWTAATTKTLLVSVLSTDFDLLKVNA
jgi:hypothetical protein